MNACVVAYPEMLMHMLRVHDDVIRLLPREEKESVTAKNLKWAESPTCTKKEQVCSSTICNFTTALPDVIIFV